MEKRTIAKMVIRHKSWEGRVRVKINTANSKVPAMAVRIYIFISSIMLKGTFAIAWIYPFIQFITLSIA